MILALEEVLEIDPNRSSLAYLPLACCYAERSEVFLTPDMICGIHGVIGIKDWFPR